MNLYPIILGSVALAGIGISVWGWLTLSNSRKTKLWPTVEGVIEESKPAPEESDSINSDLLPHIVFSYNIEGKQYRHTFEFPAGTHPLPEFNQTYLNKYPVGEKVKVYYHPEHPGIATLEPETQGDWMILALGIIMTAGGVIALFAS